MRPGLTVHDLKDLWQKSAADPAGVRAMLARIPPSWTMVSSTGDGAMFKRGGVQVICSLSREEDGELWVHVSACGREGGRFSLPSWESLKRVKHDFFGDGWAYQVFPPKEDYVNIHPYVLHLFGRFDGKPALPDFTRGTGSI